MLEILKKRELKNKNTNSPLSSIFKGKSSKK